MKKEPPRTYGYLVTVNHIKTYVEQVGRDLQGVRQKFDISVQLHGALG